MVLMLCVLLSVVLSLDMMWGFSASLRSVLWVSVDSLVNVGVKCTFGALLISLLVLLIVSNLCGMSTEVFSMFYPCIMMFSMMFWIMVVVDDMVNSGVFLSHFVPSGVGLCMGAVLSVLELFSHVIRPVTLCVRLGTNITAGHVMMGMLSMFCYSSVFLFVLVLMFVCLVVLLEIVVAFLQSYIFSALLLLYHSEFA
uniref:ATP synthase subunit a n=1 Tax=Moniliformis sp. TaxID=3068474 RepID=A0AA96ZZM8_9BILA|nr:ATPase subunit 6 [Moniliformis sp.]